MDFESVWQSVAVVVVVAGAILLGKLIIAEKKIDGYYLSRGQDSVVTATCVYSHWTWHNDEKAFCTNSFQEALEVLERANATVRK
jgi:hypothetical protein